MHSGESARGAARQQEPALSAIREAIMQRTDDALAARPKSVSNDSMSTASDFLHLSPRELRAELSRGHAIDPAALDNLEFKGVSLGLPDLIERLTWKKFMKTFHRDPASGLLRGWNVRIQQTPLEDQRWEPMLKAGEVFSFGHYQVLPLEGYRVPGPALRAGLMIDYGRGGNKPLDVMRRVRDPLVAVEQGSTELLLGWSYLDLGWTQLSTPSFFTLERYRELSHHAHPPALPR